MPIELKIDSRRARIKILEHNGTQYKVDIDNRIYDLDLVKVESDAYSILLNGQSVNMEMIQGEDLNHYKVNTINNYYEIEVIDAATRYRNASKSSLDSGSNVISTPMPGKIVKIPVKVGDQVEKGQTVIIVSAMKMESEYKSAVDGEVKCVHVAEGDAVEGNQPLIEIE
ncbi:acetyl-CoA carboxylase biotin carboxyl carrier protein subunit [Carboxylicivirga sp. A043]|uniref:acetyl-CoA carboxylase biotin carboxyl carrier protein subunit n=1 Tax=Carboxylicivirga litoralis TaxID=2816963 RepID=UPI0021CB98B4|nr:acetyl-CoA carboxylase biotin carboxyl carrier protein subunit [Carboxylicivirga sp. A043]MCU4157732.1 acetyl-CoA carboxylase biotin carboxyl carrier protein subunit [Carboxylicivirga sp. A043]